MKALTIISVEDHTGVERKAWPVTGGIPFANETCFHKDGIGTAEKTSQYRVPFRWADGSIKWSRFDYQADINSKNKSVCPIQSGIKPAVGCVGANSDKFGVKMVMKDMGLMYPKGLSFNPDQKAKKLIVR